jgi:hypothetical protein
MFKLNRISFIIPLLALPFFMPSCSVFDPPIVVPIYGHIDSIHFYVPADSAAKLGSASANIQYAWVYLDDNPVGAFQMPCTFPMIGGAGVHNVSIYSGIAGANTNYALSINPFYQFYSVNLYMVPGNKYTFHPVSTYYDWVKFPYMENFNDQSPGSQPEYLTPYRGSLGPSDTTMVVTNLKSLVFPGNQGAGMVIVTPPSTHHGYYCGISDSITLPTTGEPVYVELNYRCTTQFSVGVFESNLASQVSPCAVFYPTTTWKKGYVSLNNTIQTFNLETYNLYFVFASDTIDNHSADTLLLDNIKIDD